MISNVSEKYTFNIVFQAFDLDYEINEYIEIEPIRANNVDELFLKVQPLWLDSLRSLSVKFPGNTDVSLTLHCDGVVRNSDGVMDSDNFGIPQSSEIADELIEKLDP